MTSATHTLQDSYTYDADGNVLTSVQSDLTGGDPSRTTTYTYNDHDEVATVTQPGGATTGGTAQSDGAPSANPDGATTGYTYDAFGNVTQVTDPNGNEYQYTYNEYSELTQETLLHPVHQRGVRSRGLRVPGRPGPRRRLRPGAGLVRLRPGRPARGDHRRDGPDHQLRLRRQPGADESSIHAAVPSTAPCTSSGPCTPTAQCTSGRSAR